MEPEQFLEELATFAQSEGGVQKLRNLLLQLAEVDALMALCDKLEKVRIPQENCKRITAS
jgi:hypothetical protein